MSESLKQVSTRKHLPHDIPPWVPASARYFVTINCRTRGGTELCEPIVAANIIGSLNFYEQTGRCYPWLIMVMPDHVHLIATFLRDPGIRAVISAWKGYHARRDGIKWQSGFFEHRLRNEDEFREKAHYVRMNPVRAMLIDSPELWRHCWERQN